MVKINNKQFKIYDLDSNKTIYERIAADMKTLPKFLIFKGGIPDIEIFSTDKNIEVLNLLDIIENTPNIKEIYTQIKNFEEELVENIIFQNCVYYYTILNKDFDNNYNLTIEYGDLYKITIINGIVLDINFLINKYNIKDYFNVKNKIEELWVRRKGNKQTLNTTIENNINNWNLTYSKKNEIQIFNLFEIENSVEYTEFELEKVKFEFEIKLENVSSILEIFNNINVNLNIPFATTNKFYKILNGFIPPVEWANLFDKSTSFRDKSKDIDRENNIILKVLEEKKVKNKESYTEIILSIKKLNTIEVKVEYNKENISKKEVINRFLSIFNTKNKIENEKEDNVNGVFYIPVQKLNKEVILDMIMNNSLFSNLIVVNESKIGKRSSLHIYFENSKIGKISAKLTPSIIEKNNYLTYRYKNFPLDSSYVRIKITKCGDVEKVKNFQKIFSKLISIYNKDIDNVIEIYENYFCPIAEEEYEKEDDKELKNKKKKLRDVEPFVFQANYGRYCDSQPTYITDEEAKIQIEEGNENRIIRFPKEEIDEIFPKYYMCNDNGNRYPGLRDNPYQNNDILPYIPCCYEKEQKNISGSKYRNYYNNESLNERENKGQDIKKSNKILEDKTYGYLPENLNKLFFIGDQDGIYYREGVFRNKSSFLNCVMQVLNEETKILKYRTEEKRLPQLNIKRKELATAEFAAYCKQEMYDYTIDEIRKKIEDPEEYFDPKLFIHLLEIHFNCNIFLFSRENNGQIIIPRNIQCYYKMKNKNKCIFIFEHLGSRADEAKYPQCELIIKQTNEFRKDTENIFNFDTLISKNIFNVFNNYNISYVTNKKISLIDIKWPWENAISQSFDSYGKTRIININYNNNIVSIITSPIQPVNLKEDNKNIIYKTTSDIAQKILKDFKAQNIDEDIGTKKIKGVIGDIHVYIQLNEDINLTESLDKSTISEYNKHRKLSRYIIEYLFWLFSKYLNDNGIIEDNITEDVYKNFKNQYIQIDNTFKYHNIEKLFSMKNSGIIRGGKLIIKSEEPLKRLFYVLRLKLIRDAKDLINYYQKTMIEQYYLDITDFKYNNKQLVLQGEKAFYRLINEDTKNIIHKEIYLKKNKIDNEDEDDDDEDQEKDDDKEVKTKKKNYDIIPYFFKNKLIDNKIYLAQNVDSFEKGIKISEIWNNDNYNPGSIIKINNNLNMEEFTVYSFMNTNNIKKYHVEGNKNNLDIKIIGCKIKDINTYKLIPLYTVLLPL